MDRIRLINDLVKRADEKIRGEHINWATEHCLLVEELKEILGHYDFRGFVKEWDAQGNQVMREVGR